MSMSSRKLLLHLPKGGEDLHAALWLDGAGRRGQRQETHDVFTSVLCGSSVVWLIAGTDACGSSGLRYRTSHVSSHEMMEVPWQLAFETRHTIRVDTATRQRLRGVTCSVSQKPASFQKPRPTEETNNPFVFSVAFQMRRPVDIGYSHKLHVAVDTVVYTKR